MPIEHLILQSPKKCFHDAVVIAVSFARHGLDDVMLFKPFSEVLVLILPALVRMEDQTIHMRKLYKCTMKDYKESAEFILSRLTNSVKYKTEKYLSDNSIGKRDLSIIIGLGELSYGPMLGGYGMEILSFFVGKDERAFSVDLNTGEVIRSGYAYKLEFKNQ